MLESVEKNIEELFECEERHIGHTVFTREIGSTKIQGAERCPHSIIVHRNFIEKYSEFATRIEFISTAVKIGDGRYEMMGLMDIQKYLADIILNKFTE